MEDTHVNYLDVTVDFSNGTFESYKKNKVNLIRINTFSNLPFSTKNALVFNTSQKNTFLSPNIHIVNYDSKYYNITLVKACYKRTKLNIMIKKLKMRKKNVYKMIIINLILIITIIVISIINCTRYKQKVSKTKIYLS